MAEAGTAGSDELNTQGARSLLDGLANWGVEHLCISGGEFTTRDDWRELLSFALERFKRTILITNGWRGSELLEFLEEEHRKDRLTVMVSVDGDREAHDARRGIGSFERARALLLGAQPPVSWDVLTTVDRRNRESLKELSAQLLELSVQGWTIQPVYPLGKEREQESWGLEGFRWVGEYLVELAKHLGNTLPIYTSDLMLAYLEGRRDLDCGVLLQQWKGCPAGSRQIVVQPDGGFRSCALWEGEEEIWGGDDLQQAWRSSKREVCLERVAEAGRGRGLQRCPAAVQMFPSLRE